MWSLAYKKSLPCLQIGTTSRIESLNSLIKDSLSHSSRICELLHRMLKLHSHILNKPLCTSKVISDQFLEELENINLLSQLKDITSQWAYKQCAVNLSQSWGFEIKSSKSVVIIKDPETDYSLELDKMKKGFLTCKCSYFIIMGLPCKHLFAIAKEFPKLVNLKTNVRARWLKINSFVDFDDSLLINIIDDQILKQANDGKIHSGSHFTFKGKDEEKKESIENLGDLNAIFPNNGKFFYYTLLSKFIKRKEKTLLMNK